MKNEELAVSIEKELRRKTGDIKKPAEGILNHDYLVPAGFYLQQWDWDAFFMGIAISSWRSSEAIYLKNLTLNIIENADDEGFVPGCLTPKGASKTLKQAKPFTAQGALRYSEIYKDFTWLSPYIEKLEKVVLQREIHNYHEKYGLCSWFDAMESGADNNLAILGYEDNTVLAPDLNTFLYMEYRAFAKICYGLGIKEKSDIFNSKSDRIKENMMKHLWNDEDACFYTYDTVDEKHIKLVSYSSLIPLWGNLATDEQGKRMIEKYVLNSDELLSEHGIRTLSIKHEAYNQVNMIVPESNWQGPVWPIANYLHCHGLALYGYKKEAMEIIETVINLCLKDIETSGGMHENYDAETGLPLAAPDFVSWNMLLINVQDEIENGNHPLSQLF